MVVWGGHNGFSVLRTGGLYSLGQLASTWYRDLDGDAYGDSANSVTISGCDGPPGYVLDNSDCDDNNSGIHPGVTEICNSIDDNCAGGVDEGVTRTFYRDVDGDGFGVTATTTQACTTPVGYADRGGDRILGPS